MYSRVSIICFFFLLEIVLNSEWIRKTCKAGEYGLIVDVTNFGKESLIDCEYQKSWGTHRFKVSVTYTLQISNSETPQSSATTRTVSQTESIWFAQTLKKFINGEYWAQHTSKLKNEEFSFTGHPSDDESDPKEEGDVDNLIIL